MMKHGILLWQSRVKISLIVSICVLLCPPVLAQTNNTYIKKGSIEGKNISSKEVSKKAFAFVPVSEWIGERFIFLPKSKSLQHYGYQKFNVSYDSYVGRIAKVISVDMSDYYFPKVLFKMEDDGKELCATVYCESIEDIAPVSDIDSARSQWLNKTLWFKKTELESYNEEKDKFSGTKLKKFSPVKVINIVAGWRNDEPIRFILQTKDGNEGFVDVNLSGTNVSDILQDHSHFDEFFFTINPKKKYHWNERVWKAIEGGKVFIGMTTEQAKLSWGKPSDINRTNTGAGIHEQWVYRSGSYLYFENGILTTVQN